MKLDVLNRQTKPDNDIIPNPNNDTMFGYLNTELILNNVFNRTSLNIVSKKTKNKFKNVAIDTII